MSDCLTYPSINALRRLRTALVAEFECRTIDPCRIDIIVSDSATQRGADLTGPAGQGRAWIREVTDQAQDQNNPCGGTYIRTFEIGVERCHETVDDDGKSLPAHERYLFEADRAYIDRDAVEAAVRLASDRNFDRGAGNREQFRWVSWRPHGPSSYAIGGITTVTAQHWRC